MKAIVKNNDRGPPAGVTRNLDRVLYGLGATVKKDGLLREFAGDQFAEAFGQFDVGFVHYHAKAGMREFRSLLGDGREDFRARVANVHCANASGEVNIPVAINIFDHRALGSRNENIHRGRGAACDKLLLACQQLARFFSGNAQIWRCL